MEEALAKPDELLALDEVTAELFATLKEWFDVPDAVTLDLSRIDASVSEMSDPVMIAALAMRKLQALQLLAVPGVRTTTDVVVAIVQDLDRALVQAPHMYLNRLVDSADWDAAWEALDSPAASHPSAGPIPVDSREQDPEIDRFRELHGRLHDAVRAVVEASNGEIRHFA